MNRLIVREAFRFRLYPNRRQEQKLLMMIQAGRQLWNDALAHRKRRWEGKQLLHLIQPAVLDSHCRKAG